MGFSIKAGGALTISWIKDMVNLYFPDGEIGCMSWVN